MRELTDDILGHGPLEQLLADDTITEIMVNGPHEIWIERQGRLYRTDVRFTDDSHLRRIIVKMVAQAGRRVDESTPMVDARLADGSRLNAVLPPLSLGGPLLTIRKFPKRRLGAADLSRLGTLTPETVDFLDRCVKARLERIDLRRHRYGQDHASQRAIRLYPRAGPCRHDRGDSGVAVAPGACAASRGTQPQRRGRRRDLHPRPRSQHPAHAPRPHHRRRGARRRGARHAAGDEHGPRRLASARCTRTPRATRSRGPRRWC